MPVSVKYSFSLTTFSPSGKLVQIEYALNAVAAGSTSLGIKVGCLLRARVQADVFLCFTHVCRISWRPSQTNPATSMPFTSACSEQPEHPPVTGDEWSGASHREEAAIHPHR